MFKHILQNLCTGKMKKLLCVLIIVTLAGCSDKKEDNKNIQESSTNTSEENWTEYNTRDSIPELFNEALGNFHKGNFELANPDERFNATDMITDSLPRQKLSLLSKSGDKWRLTYIQGGFGKYYVYAQCEIRNDSIHNFVIAESILALEDHDSIDKYLSENKLKIRNVN